MAEGSDDFMSLFRRIKARPDDFYTKAAAHLRAQDVFDVADLVDLPAGVLKESLESAGTTTGMLAFLLQVEALAKQDAGVAYPAGLCPPTLSQLSCPPVSSQVSRLVYPESEEEEAEEMKNLQGALTRLHKKLNAPSVGKDGEDTNYDICDQERLREIIGKPADHQEKRLKFTKALTETQIDFIGRSPFCLIASIDETGTPCVSPKGDAPGFVQTLSPDQLLVPERAGNKLIYTLLNILRHPQVQILFMIPNTCETLRVSGRASLSQDPTVCARFAAGGQDALLVIRVSVTECYYHCAKSLVRSQLWKPETWPVQRFKIGLGRILAKNAGKDAAWADEYERGAAERLQVVETHYVDNVWKPIRATPPVAPSSAGLGKVREGAVLLAVAAVCVVVFRASRQQL